MKKYKLKIEILSPLHIGCGEEINPLNYIIKKNRFYRISLEKFVSNMDGAQRTEFEGVIEENDLLELRKHFIRNMDVERESLYSLEVPHQIRKLYESKLGDIRNQLLIHPFIRTGDQSLPLVPGSSIKGAIRTAIISELAKNSGLAKPRGFREEYEFESKVLGCKDAKEDPFRGIKIRDRSLADDSTIIREIKNMTKARGKGLRSNDIQLICEVTHSQATGKEVVFETELLFDEELFSTSFLGKELDMDEMIESCVAFHKDKMEKEHNKFYRNTEAESPSILLLNTEFNDASFPLRLGRFSGVESVTLDEYRNPKPPGRSEKWGTSRNLAEEKYPMGWIKVSVNEKT